MKFLLLPVFIFYLSLPHTLAQDSNMPQKMDFSGYVSVMPSLFWMTDSGQSLNESTMWQVLLHNRLNFHWYPTEALTVCIEARNQFVGGDFVSMSANTNGFKKENYAIPMTYHQKLGDRYLISAALDRLWLQYTIDKFEIKLGRQRINWGQTFAWNPNDIFNSYNFFDFDYPERPGADALRLQYFASATSSVDLAAKIDSSGYVSAGGIFRFNRLSTDFQLLCGYLQQKNRSLTMPDTLPVIKDWDDRDLVTGMGFSGAIKSVSIRGEASYFYSLKAGVDSTNLFLVSLGADYAFANQVGVMLEILYNSRILLSEGGSFLDMYNGNQSIKTPSFTKFNLFGQISYPVSPIVNINMGGMFFIDSNRKGLYTGPSLDLSMGDNLTLSGIYQLFAFQMGNSSPENKDWAIANFAFTRLKWNF